MGREDTNCLCAASPVRELSIRPARESKDSGAGESDMACRTIRIGMGQRFERIVRVTAVWKEILVKRLGTSSPCKGGLLDRDIRYVDSQDLFDNLDFDEEIEGTSTRVSRFRIAGGFFAARASFWTAEATLV